MANEIPDSSTHDLQAIARAAFRYNPSTGELFHKERPDRTPQWNGRYAGKVAGRPDRHGHIRIDFEGANAAAHRVIWLIVTGRWPANDIDHVNGDGADNRWLNLREATRQQNLWNMKRKPKNTTGFKGVSKHSQCNRWVAQIRGPGSRMRYLGIFKTPEEAHAAYCAAARELHGEFFRPE